MRKGDGCMRKGESVDGCMRKGDGCMRKGESNGADNQIYEKTRYNTRTGTTHSQ